MVEKREILDEKKRVISQRRRWILLGILGVFCLVIAFFVVNQCTDLIVRVAEDVYSEPQNGDWAMFRRDPAHTGNAGTNSTLPEGTLKWTFATGGPIHSSPAVSGGTVYFGSRDYNIYALDAATGDKLWSYKTDSWVESSPVVVGGVLYCGSNDGNLYALDAGTGEKLWSFSAPYAIRSSPAVADGIVYFGCDDHHVYAVDVATGEELWKGDTEHTVISAPVVSEGILLVGSVDGKFYSFNAKTGSARIQLETNYSVITSPAVKDGIAYFTDGSNYFYAIDIKAKNWLWENIVRVYWNTLHIYGVAPSPPNASGFLWDVSLGWGIRTVSSPSIVDNHAYLGAGHNLVAVDLTTHQVQWTFTTNDDVSSSPAVAGTAVYVGSEDGNFYAIDRTDGLKIWEYATGDEITSSPAVGDGIVYVGSHDGKLYAFN